MDMGDVGMTIITITALCCSFYTDIESYRNEKEDEANLTFWKWLRRNPVSPMAVVYILFFLVSYPIGIMLDDKSVAIGKVSFGVLQLVVFVIMGILTLYLELTKDKKRPKQI